MTTCTKQKYFLPILFFVLISLFACNKAQEKDNFNLTAEELITAMKSDSDLVILDVRTPPELIGKHGQIKGVINIPVQVLETRINELDGYKNNNIAVICRSGNRSVNGTKILLQNGFKAKNVLGGMKAYNKLK
ncbi:MAG: rhodanese-like domain-containing protein [Deltaproteobacteria bacterium]|nr:rhodanese-like domain-containing protein [Deltaproteobacteria bacterium]